MQKVTFKELNEQHISVELTKTELFVLLAGYSSFLQESGMKERIVEAYPERTEATTNCVNLIADQVSDSQDCEFLDEPDFHLKTVEKLSLILLNSIVTKH